MTIIPTSLDLYSIRKQLHMIPEPAFQEYKTRSFLLHHLEKMTGITIHYCEKSTGIIVEYSHGKGEYLLLRADMDALNIKEATGCDFTSLHPGVMHACGHDVHMTILLGVIDAVVQMQPHLNLLFLFQPAEEGKGGAQSVLEEGIIQRFPIRAAAALHVSGSLPVNTVSSKAGIFFAIPQEFDVCFRGKSAHAAFPQNGRNALLAGVEFLNTMQQKASLYAQDEPCIFNVGVLKSGTVRNIIPDKCLLEGTHRTLNRNLRDRLNKDISTVAREVSDKYQVQNSVDFLCSYDPVVNDSTLYDKLKAVCAAEHVKFEESPVYMTGEDFGFFTTLYPGILFWLGAAENNQDLHSDTFLPDEACIPVGVKLFLQLISTV